MKASPFLVRWLFLTLVLVLVAAPALAGNVVPAGVDLWSTAGEGRTYASFASEPIPAGFFCPDSKPFTGRIAFQGTPVASDPAASLGGADTIVRRLDDAAFNDKGEASTRIQMMALSLVSVAPIDTGCGLYNVAASLEPGEQPTTTMHIVKTEKNGGTYSAPLSLKVRLVFTPASGPGERRELTRPVALGPSDNAVWTFAAKPRYRGSVVVDTDGDRKPDTVLPKSSNFVTGVAPAASTTPVTTSPCVIGTDATSCPVGYCLFRACHCNPNRATWDPDDPGENCTYLHCLWVCRRCYVQAEDEPVGSSSTE